MKPPPADPCSGEECILECHHPGCGFTAKSRAAYQFAQHERAKHCACSCGWGGLSKSWKLHRSQKVRHGECREMHERIESTLKANAPDCG